MTKRQSGPDAFFILGALNSSWKDISDQVIADNQLKRDSDPTVFNTHANRLVDSENLLFLGYVYTHKKIMQSSIVNTLVKDDHPDVEKERQKVRQSLKRRGDSCEFYGLIDREYFSKVAVEFRITADGEEYLKEFNELFNSLVKVD